MNSATSNAAHENTSVGESGHASPYKTATEITQAMGKIRNRARIASHVGPRRGAPRAAAQAVTVDGGFVRFGISAPARLDIVDPAAKPALRHRHHDERDRGPPGPQPKVPGWHSARNPDAKADTAEAQVRLHG